MCGYATAKNTIYSLQVCNDSIARGIKLVTDLLHVLHKEENLQIVYLLWKAILEKSLTLENVLSNLLMWSFCIVAE